MTARDYKRDVVFYNGRYGVPYGFGKTGQLESRLDPWNYEWKGHAEHLRQEKAKQERVRLALSRFPILLDSLSREREREIIRLRFMTHPAPTQKEIGRTMGVTGCRIGQLESVALRRLLRELQDRGIR